MSRTRGGRPIGIDLFAGAGGMSLGFEQAGFEVVAAVEIDPIHAATHEFNFPDCRIFCDDASQLDGAEILDQLDLDRGDVNVVFGGPPCQGFSLMGKRLVDDPRNSLLFHFLRLVQGIRPDYFVMENVQGLCLGQSISVLDAFISLAAKIGYKTISPTRVLNAASFGVPQDRRRVFVYGYRKGCAPPAYPTPSAAIRGKGNGTPLFPDSGNGALPYGPSVWDAIGDLPDIDDFEELRSGDSVRHRLTGGSAYARTLRGERRDPSDYSHSRHHDRAIMTGSMRAEHTALSRQRFKATLPGTIEPVSRFFKLPPDGVANTLRAGTPSNRGAFTSPRPIHPSSARCISVREAARLHSYPDWFRFHVTKWHGFRQIGNSVPPLLARAVAAEVARAENYSPVRPTSQIELGTEDLLKVDMRSAAARYGVSPHVIEPRTRVAK